MKELFNDILNEECVVKNNNKKMLDGCSDVDVGTF